MSNFPVGSKIIIKNAEEGETYKNGDIFTVIATNGVGVWVSCAVGSCYISSYEFEAYTEYKVGDKVAVIKTNGEWDYYAGQTGVVDYIDSHEPKVRLKGVGYHFTEDLKLAPAKAEPTPTSHIKVLATRHPREYEVGDILEVSENQTWCGGGEIRVVNKHGYTSVVFEGQWEYVAAPVVAPERKFNVGDKVVVKANPEWGTEGWTGVIESVDEEAAATLPYEVKWDNDKYNLWMREQDLELVKEFTFTDIQKGDTIRAEWEAEGAKRTVEGVTSDYTNGTSVWVTSGCAIVANKRWPNATYTLLERPEPPKPNPFAEAKVGSIATYGEEGVKYLKTGENAWAPISRKGTLSDYRNSDESMTNCGDLIQVTHNA